MQTTTVPTIAETIAAQLGGTHRLRAMIGAHGFMGSDRTLTFRFTARALSGINAVVVELSADDTYRVAFYAVRGPSRRLVSEATGVYADGLRETIEHATGLYLSL